MCNVTPPPHSGGGFNICVEEPAGKLGENYGLYNMMAKLSIANY
jgi:hypothetical protein